MTGLIKDKEFVRYIFIGAVNTLISYTIYFILLMFFPYAISFSIAFFLGIITSYYLNTKIVFKCNVSLRKFLSFPLVYVVQYLFNMFFLYLFVEKMHLSEKFAPIFGIVVAIPITFLLSKSILKNKEDEAE